MFLEGLQAREMRRLRCSHQRSEIRQRITTPFASAVGLAVTSRSVLIMASTAP